MRELSIYIHIPFCVRKCLYCDFLSAPAGRKEMESYVNLLLREIEKQSIFYGDHTVISIFLGGGTPSLLSGGEVERILARIRKNFIMAPDVEITMECNPGTVTPEKMESYIASGINRLSIGLQSTEDEELARIGRIHSYGDFLEIYELARGAGFGNINIDLMSGLSGQSSVSWKKTLERVTALLPEHISAYSLILEEGTPLYVNQSGYTFPTEEEDREMYRLTGEYLREAGFHRYEISNYARKGRECRHNRVYWQRGDYIGLGLGASSMVNNIRWKNQENGRAYADCVARLEGAAACTPGGKAFADVLRSAGLMEVQELSCKEQMEEFMFLGLRLMEGVDAREFERLFLKSMQEVYGKSLAGLLEAGLLKLEGTRLSLTSRGIDLSNMVFAEFLL